MHRDAPTYSNADSRHLPAGGILTFRRFVSRLPVDPNTRFTHDAMTIYAIVPEKLDRCFFQNPNVCYRSEFQLPDAHDRVHDELTRTVIRGFPSAVSFDDLNVSCRNR